MASMTFRASKSHDSNAHFFVLVKSNEFGDLFKLLTAEHSKTRNLMEKL